MFKVSQCELDLGGSREPVKEREEHGDSVLQKDHSIVPVCQALS